MTWTLCVLPRVFALPLAIVAFTTAASAQTPPAGSPPSAQFSDPPPEPAAPPPPPAPPPTEPAPQPAPAPAQPQPQAQPVAPQQPAQPPPQPYAQDPYAQPGYGQRGTEPPPPPAPPEEGDGFKMPGFALRIDPLDLLLEGKLGFEVELGLWKFITFEVVPTFIVNDSPPTFNLSGREDSVTQESNGVGPLAGASFAAGFWLQGKPFKGYVLRAMLTNVSMKYLVDEGATDEATHTEQHLLGFFGSYNRWGAFTLGGGMGLGVELNKESRCFVRSVPNAQPTSNCPDEEFQLKLDNRADQVIPLNSPLYPVEFLFRLSLGIVID